MLYLGVLGILLKVTAIASMWLPSMASVEILSVLVPVSVSNIFFTRLLHEYIFHSYSSPSTYTPYPLALNSNFSIVTRDPTDTPPSP